MLDTYTLEELCYEYNDYNERIKAAEDHAEEETDRIEEEKMKSAIDWAEEEEQKELQELRKRQKEEKEKWMQEQLKKNKEEHGEDFGEDVSIDFGEL